MGRWISVTWAFLSSSFLLQSASFFIDCGAPTVILPGGIQQTSQSLFLLQPLSLIFSLSHIYVF